MKYPEKGKGVPAPEKVQKAIEKALEEDVFPGCQILISKNEKILGYQAFGKRALLPKEEPNSLETVYDVASLTKVLSTTTLIMQLHSEGRIDLDSEITEYLEDFEKNNYKGVTVRHCLSHCSGLVWWLPLYESLKSIEEYYNFLKTMGPEVAPGSRSLYSDPNFWILGFIIKKITGKSIDALFNEKIKNPLALNMHFRPLEKSEENEKHAKKALIAPTEDCPQRGLLRGEVHDDNCHAMGGVGGHAGLFSEITDVHKLVSALADIYHGRSQKNPLNISREILTLYFERQRLDPEGYWALGWSVPSPGISSSGNRFSLKSVGMTGFTGTSVWIDLARDIHVILLSNRVHPSREDNRLKDFRQIFHDSVLEAILPEEEIVKEGDKKGDKEKKGDKR